MRGLVILIGALLGGSVHAFCFEKAGAEYNVNPLLLQAMAQVESTMQSQAINTSHQERTKTVDIGLMQINSGNLPALAKEGISKKDLLDDPCLNVRVGARILAEKFKKTGANWEGVGAYNAACTQLKGEDCRRARDSYTSKVWLALTRLQRERQAISRTEMARLTTTNKKVFAEIGSRIASVSVSASEIDFE